MYLRLAAIMMATAVACSTAASVAYGSAGQDAWLCALDLHQGDSGTLKFTLTGTALHGEIAVTRETTPEAMTSTVSGTWSGNVIQFTRTLTPSTSIQPFTGVALSGDDQVMMAGRFAGGFAGIWSASCSTDGKKPPTVADSPAGDPGADPRPGPTVSMRIEPRTPSTGDRVRFVIEARGTTEVRGVTLHLNDRLVHTCPRLETCEFSGGPYPAGPLEWRVMARAMDGGVTTSSGRVLVRALPGKDTGACSITGAAAGPRAEVAKVFSVALFGPDNEKLFRERQPMGTGRFRFDKLPPGRYVLVPDTRADISVSLTPRRREVTCKGGLVSGVDFEFR